MESTVIEFAKTQGPWALFFAFLLIWVLRENSKRETKYQGIIETLSNKFESIEKGVERLENKFSEWIRK